MKLSVVHMGAANLTLFVFANHLRWPIGGQEISTGAQAGSQTQGQRHPVIHSSLYIRFTGSERLSSTAALAVAINESHKALQGIRSHLCQVDCRIEYMLDEACKNMHACGMIFWQKGSRSMHAACIMANTSLLGM